HEDQRAVVGHEESLEEAFRGAEGVANPAPDAAAAHLGARAVEALDRAFRMLDGGLADFPLDLQPVANDANLAEGHARLGHAERTGIHPQEDRFLAALAVALEIALVRL